jgi:hypothetical protein
MECDSGIRPFKGDKEPLFRGEFTGFVNLGWAGLSPNRLGHRISEKSGSEIFIIIKRFYLEASGSSRENFPFPFFSSSHSCCPKCHQGGKDDSSLENHLQFPGGSRTFLFRKNSP